MHLVARLAFAILAVPLVSMAGTAQGAGTGGPIPSGPFVTSGMVTSDIVLTNPGYVASDNAVTVTLLGLQHDFAGDLQITLSYISSNGSAVRSVDLLNRIGATTANPYGTAADFGNNQDNGDNYQFNTDYVGNIWNVANCSDPPACTEPYGDADSLPGVSTDTINHGQYFTSTVGGAKTNLSYAFAGLNVGGGTWRLTITDAADPNVGSFVGWQISIATVSTVPATITAVAGTPQSATVTTSFAGALQAKVTDASANPVSGVSVTFTAPSSGASATFSGASSATAVTNASGIAVSPVPVANLTAGAYIVSASVPGLTPASFALTNTAATSGSPLLTLSSSHLIFGAQAMGTGASQTLTVTSSGNAPLSINTVQVSGTNAGDFTANNGCAGSVAAGATCNISVTFDPKATGTRTASLAITDNALSSPQAVALSGTAAAAPATFTTYLSPYGSGFQTIAGASVLLPLRAYFPGGASQISYLIAYLNSTASGVMDYAIVVESNGSGGYVMWVQNSTTGTSAIQMTPSGSTVTLSTPLTLGTLQITAYRCALAGNEFQLDLSVTRSGTFNDQVVIIASEGAGYSAPWMASDGDWNSTAANSPGVKLSTTSLTFGSQAVGASASQKVIVTNSGTAPLSVTSAPISGTNAGDFTAADGCTSSVAAGASCTITVTFDPLAAGSRTATLSIADNASGSPQKVALSGTGSAAPTPTTFTTYLSPYGSGFQTITGNSVLLPLRAYFPGGASQISYLIAYLNATAGGAMDYEIVAETDGGGGYNLRIVNSAGAYAPAWPFLEMTPSGSTVTLPTPITLGTLQITAYRFALAGNEFQLDLSVTCNGTFNDQVVIIASEGAGYSAPWMASDGDWIN